jgi:hypothetical protein
MVSEILGLKQIAVQILPRIIAHGLGWERTRFSSLSKLYIKISCCSERTENERRNLNKD